MVALLLICSTLVLSILGLYATHVIMLRTSQHAIQCILCALYSIKSYNLNAQRIYYSLYIFSNVFCFFFFYTIRSDCLSYSSCSIQVRESRIFGQIHIRSNPTSNICSYCCSNLAYNPRQAYSALCCTYSFYSLACWSRHSSYSTWGECWGVLVWLGGV